MNQGQALRDVIAEVHAHPWVMAPVPDAKWDWFTTLTSTGAVQMWTRSDLLDVLQAEQFTLMIEAAMLRRKARETNP